MMRRGPHLLTATVIFVSCSVSTAQQNPHGQLPVTTATQPFLLLLHDPVVHDDLALTPKQRAAMSGLTDEIDGPLWSLRNKPTSESQQKRNELAAKAQAKLATILTADQQLRLQQIELWTLGMRAFNSDALPDRLGLSDSQRSRIQDAATHTQEMLGRLFQRQSEHGDTDTIEAKALRVEQQKKVLKILTDAQRRQWVSLLGRRIDVSQLGRIRFRAPEIQGEGVTWINSQSLSVGDLRGKVVALHFYAFGCINCKRNFPWYKGWHESFAKQGLVVLGIHTPETAKERDVANVQREATDAGLTFPIVADSASRNWDVWGNAMWPSVYLIDKQGYVRYWWYGELNWQGAQGEQLLRTRIQELLAEST